MAAGGGRTRLDHVRAALRRMVTSSMPATDRWIRPSAALVGALAPAMAIGAKDSPSALTPSAVQIPSACRVYRSKTARVTQPASAICSVKPSRNGRVKVCGARPRRPYAPHPLTGLPVRTARRTPGRTGRSPDSPAHTQHTPSPQQPKAPLQPANRPEQGPAGQVPAAWYRSSATWVTASMARPPARDRGVHQMSGQCPAWC